MTKGDRVGLQLRAVHIGRTGSAGQRETGSGLRTTARRPFPGSARVLALGVAAALVAVIVASLAFTLIPAVRAELVLPPPSLKMVPVPEPPNLLDFVQDRQAAIRLGKALFWDMQLGSDGGVACATCHFQAGADVRAKNQMNPGGDGSFQVGGPNSTLAQEIFPLHQRRAPVDLQASGVLRDTNDVLGSQGVRSALFVDISGGAVDTCTPTDDATFNVGGAEVRRVTGRNAPSAVNAVFNFANFWDGRANNIFNGVNPFGASDLDGKVFQNDVISGTMAAVPVRISNASLASQAVGPPLSDVEMSCAGRTFPKLGKKMLALTPLGSQLVHPSDGVLGSLARANLDGTGSATGNPGLSTTYTGLIQAAFQNKWWNNSGQIIKFQGGVPTILANPGRALLTDEFTQMEANFSLFFGLAVQLYEATLVSDDTLFDRVQEGRAAFTSKQQQGLTTFLGVGGCINCHAGPEFTNQSVRNQQELDHGVIERMFMAVGGEAIYDNGFYNIGIRPTNDDIGRGGTDGFGFDLSFSRLAELKAKGQLPAGLAAFVPALPVGVDSSFRTAVDGAFKAPGLRNIELTGPYFHNGGASSLLQVVEFYARGGNFPQNGQNLDPDIVGIPGLQGSPTAKDALVEFLLTLTDERVRNESAPFDHPQLILPNGAQDSSPAQDITLVLPAVGSVGRTAQGLGHVERFLGANRAPVTALDITAVPQGSASRPINVLANDSDPDGDLFTVTAVQGAQGAATIGTANAKVNYTPPAGFAGIDAFTYTITSSGPFNVTGSVSVTVHAGNLPPVAVSDTASVPAAVLNRPINVLANDSDPEGDIITVLAVTQGALGTVAVGTDGANVLYTPGPTFTGDTFTYTLTDGVLTSTAAVSLTLNVPPVPGNDTATVPQESVDNVFNVLANDSDPSGDPIRIVDVTLAQNGKVAISAGGDSVLYTPNPGFFGGDAFTYTISDGVLLGDGIVNVMVNANNRAPLPGSDVFTVTQNSTNNALAVLANDADFDGNPLTVTAVTQPASGGASIGAGGANILYTPTAGFAGVDALTYTVSDGVLTGSATVSVTVNRPPLAALDSITVKVNSSNNPVNVLANDSDPDGNPLRISSVSGGANGTAAIGPAGGNVVYTPSPGFGGLDSFTYAVTDGALTASATVSVTVNRPPVAAGDSFTVPQDSADVPLNVLGNDSDPDGDFFSITAVSGAGNGTRIFEAGGANVVYTPNPGFTGSDSFIYNISDGTFTSIATVTVTVQRSNRSPAAINDLATVPTDSAQNIISVLSNDTDPDSNPIKVIAVTQGAQGQVVIGPDGANVVYLPRPGFAGEDSFTYTVSDGFLSSSGSVAVTVHRENRGPVAFSYAATVLGNTSNNAIGVLATISDPDGDVVRIIGVTRASNGTVSVGQGGTIVLYTPNLGFVGTDSFNYMVSDGFLTSTNTVTVTVLRPPSNRLFLPVIVIGRPSGW